MSHLYCSPEAKAESFCVQHKSRIIADAKAQNKLAENVISVHRMLGKHPDAATWAIFESLVDDYAKETGLGYPNPLHENFSEGASGKRLDNVAGASPKNKSVRTEKC